MSDFVVPDRVPCPVCAGLGGACGACDGSGKVTWDFGDGAVGIAIVAAASADVVAIVERHRAPDGAWCGGFVNLDVTGVIRDPRWQVLRSGRELTLSPSLLCRTCGNHGWIRDGKWVPA